MKQGQSGGFVVRTYQGKERVSREVRIGQAGRGRAQRGKRPMGTPAYGGKWFKGRVAVSGEMPICAAKCRQQHNQVSCHGMPGKQQAIRWAAACKPACAAKPAVSCTEFPGIRWTACTVLHPKPAHRANDSPPSCQCLSVVLRAACLMCPLQSYASFSTHYGRAQHCVMEM